MKDVATADRARAWKPLPFGVAAFVAVLDSAAALWRRSCQIASEHAQMLLWREHAWHHVSRAAVCWCVG
jgi:hypothetical protein